MTERSAPVTIGEFGFDAATGELYSNGEIRRLRPQSARALAMLVEHAGEMVSREDLRRTIWPDTVVEYDLSLNVCIRQLRVALGDDADAPRFIETLPRRGYRLVAPVSAPTSNHAAPIVTPRSLRLPGLAAVLALVIGLAGWWLARPPGTATIVVLPFRSIPPVDSLRYIEDGILEELITALAKVAPEQLTVIARESATNVSRRVGTPADAGAALGADFVLLGAFRPVETGFRVTVQLLETANATYRWTDSYDLAATDLWSLERTVAERVATTLAATLGTTLEPPAEPRPLAPGTRDTVLRARFLLERFTRRDAAGAVALLERAADEDSSTAELFVELARAHLQLGNTGLAERAIGHAGTLDGNRAGVESVAGQIALYGRYRAADAVEHLSRAAALEPGAASIRRLLANALVAAGRPTEAVVHGERALKIDPVSSTVRGDIGWVFYYARRYDDAAAVCRSMLELVPESDSARQCVILASVLNREASRASDLVDDVLVMFGATDAERTRLRGTLRDENISPLWDWLLATPGRRNGMGRLNEARVLALAGDAGASAAVLRAISESNPGTLLFVESDPVFDAVRQQGDYAAALPR